MELTMKILSEYLDGDTYVEIYKGSTACDDLVESGEIDQLRSQGLFENADWANLPIERYNGIRSDDEMLVILLDPC